MSYIDKDAGHRGQRLLTGGAVAVAQAALAVVVISGLGVVIVDRPAPDRPLPTMDFPALSQPSASPSVASDDRPVIKQDVVRPRHEPLGPLQDPGQGIVVDPVGPIIVEPSVDLVRPRVEPAPVQPPGGFEVKGVTARNNPAGWAMTSDYPTRELREGHQGAVRFKLTIDAGGKVSGCTVTASSGWPDLDRATCDLVSRRARFNAARDSAGNSVTGSYSGTIRWVIPQD